MMAGKKLWRNRKEEERNGRDDCNGRTQDWR